MSKEVWEKTYAECWKTYYSKEHVETILRRNAAMGMSVGKTMFLLNWFIGSLNIEKLHPLECGLIRRKYRRDRRPGLPIESRLTFYPRHYLDMVTKQFRWVWLWGKLWGKYYEIKHNPKKLEYTDLALTPVFDHEEDRDMFHTEEAEAYVAQQKKMRDVIDAAA